MWVQGEPFKWNVQWPVWKVHMLPSNAEWETLCNVDVGQQTQAILESQIKMDFPNDFFCMCVYLGVCLLGLV